MTKTLKVLLSLVAIIAFANPAFAHSEQISTDPADGAIINQLPENFVVTYNEDLIADGTYAVLVFNNSPTDLTAEVIANQVFIAIPADLAAGDYAVQFKSVAADGHPQEGAINFSYQPVTAVPISSEPIAEETPEVVIMQPELTETSNLNSLWAALALIAVAGVLLMRVRNRNKGNA